MKKNVKLIAAIIVVISAILLGGYLYLHSPNYTLKRVASSLKNHDWETFQKYVDVNSLYNSVIGDATENSDNDIAKGLATMMAGNLKDAFISKIKSEIENPKNDDGPGVFGSFLSLDTTVIKIETEINGKIATTKVYSKYGLFDVPAYLEITMRSEGIKYVIIGISKKNIEKRTSVARSIYKEFYMKPLREKMNQSIRISVTKKYKGCANSFYGTCFENLVMIERKIENLTNKEISKIEYQMYPNEVFTETKYSKFDSEVNIKPHEIVITGRSQGWKYNQFIDEDKIWMSVEANEVIIKPTKLTFADREEIDLDEYGYLVNTMEIPKVTELIAFGKKNGLYGADSLESWIK